MTPAIVMVRHIAHECREDMREMKMRRPDERRSFASGYWQVAVSHRPQIADHKELFMRIVEGKQR